MGFDFKTPEALQPSALFSKSQVYVRRSLAAKARGDLDVYQLWASIALELLAKSVLSSIHPCLVVDTGNPNNLLVAAGVPVDTTVKTIAAEEAYARLRHVARRFAGCYEYCKKLARRRNAELHSAELPFQGMRPEAWEGELWHAAQALLETSDLDLSDWIGAKDAKATEELISAARSANVEAAKQRVSHSRSDFSSLRSQERKARVAAGKGLTVWNIRPQFRMLLDSVWPETCPSCGSRAFVGGDRFAVEESGEDIGDGLERVEIEYFAEEFFCPVCELRLEGEEALEAAGISTSHTDFEEREIEYEPDYGNE